MNAGDSATGSAAEQTRTLSIQKCKGLCFDYPQDRSTQEERKGAPHATITQSQMAVVIPDERWVVLEC